MKKTLFAMIIIIGSLQAAASPSYWDRFTSWWGSTAPAIADTNTGFGATCRAFGSKLNENRLPAAVAGLGLLGLGYGAYRYAQSKPTDAIPAQAKTEITNAIVKGDSKALQTAITNAFDTPTLQGALTTTSAQKQAILAYALAEYKKQPANMREYHDFMSAVYNAVADTLLPMDARAQLLNSKDSPLEFRALWRTLENKDSSLGTDISTHYSDYAINKFHIEKAR